MGSLASKQCPRPQRKLLAEPTGEPGGKARAEDLQNPGAFARWLVQYFASGLHIMHNVVGAAVGIPPVEQFVC